MREDIYGVLFPVPHQYVQRLASGEKDVFVKFGRFKFLSKGKRIVFYDTGIHMLVGESKIERVAYAESEKIWRMFGSRIFSKLVFFQKYPF